MQPCDLGPHLWLAGIRKLEALHDRRRLQTHLVVVATVQAGERFLPIISERPCKLFVDMRQISVKPWQRPLCSGRAPVLEGVDSEPPRLQTSLASGDTKLG